MPEKTVKQCEEELAILMRRGQFIREAEAATALIRAVIRDEKQRDAKDTRADETVKTMEANHAQ